MFKRFIIALLIIALAALGVLYLIRTRSREQAKKSEAQERAAVGELAFASMVKKHNAIDAWDRDLSRGEPVRTAPVMTMELEKLWLTERPILFAGRIKDVRTEDQNNYRLVISQDVYLTVALARPVVRTALDLSLLCPKSMLEAFIAGHPDYLEPASGLGVIAKIDSVEPASLSEAGLSQVERKTGKGKCLDLMAVRIR